MLGRTNTGGGGGGLNFQVVGNPQPQNPKANTIWINTDTKITSYVFSATEPTGIPGLVWITTGTSSSVEFNALKKNGLQVYPISAKQYVGGAWVDKTAKSRQNGEWVDWWLGELFDNGNQYKAITGGWSKSEIAMNANNPSNGTVNIGDVISLSSTNISSTSGTSASASTVKPIDLTRFSKLYATGKATKTAISIIVSKTRSGYTGSGMHVAAIDITSTTETTVELPIAEYDEEYYISAMVVRGRAGEISKIWME